MPLHMWERALFTNYHMRSQACLPKMQCYTLRIFYHWLPGVLHDVRICNCSILVPTLADVRLALVWCLLQVCEDTFIGSDQVRGFSGGQHKRVITGMLFCCNVQSHCRHHHEVSCWYICIYMSILLHAHCECSCDPSKYRLNSSCGTSVSAGTHS